MRILLIGSGGREHALAWKLSGSALCDKLFIAPGNPGTATCGENVALDIADHAAVVAFARTQRIDLVVIGPEGPLVAGLVDDLASAGIRAFGPSRAAARLEGSKTFTKALCREAGIPTADARSFDDLEGALAHVRQHGAPIVIKADGLAAGKGVVVAHDLTEAEDAVRLILGGGFGAAGASVLIEDHLDGEEISFFALCDGTTARFLGAAQDHKRVGDGDTGPNTGGMGAYSPTALLTPPLEAEVMDRIIMPTLTTMATRGTPFRGILFAGLMLTADGPRLIEFNTRFGDPECQVLMPRLRSDLVEVLVAACDGRLDEVTLEWWADAALTVVLCAPGYPTSPVTGSVIAGLDRAEALDHTLIFQAGTSVREGRLVAAGGRVLNCVGLGATLASARDRAYAASAAIDWPDALFRRDIGGRAVGSGT